jgi:ion channel
MTQRPGSALDHAGMSARAPAGLGISREPGERWTRLAERIANAFGLVLLLVLLTYVLWSVTDYRAWTAVLTVAVASASSSVALYSAEARHSVKRMGMYLSLAAVLLAIANAAFGSNTCLAISSLIQMFLFIVAAGAVLRAVLMETKVGFRTILGAVSVYIIFGLLFTFLYVAIDRLQSGPFFGAGVHLGTGDYVFFSITTLTTTGYGNLVPAGQPGQMFAGLEMLIGQIFLVTLIAGLVSLWRPGQLARIRRSE